MDSCKYKPNCHIVNNSISEQSPVRPNYLKFYKSKRSMSGRRLVGPLQNLESRFKEETSANSKHLNTKAHELAPRGSGSDLCLEDSRKSSNRSILTTALQDSANEGPDLNYLYDTIENENSLFTSTEIASFSVHDRLVESQQNVLFKRTQESGNIATDYLNKAKNSYALSNTAEADPELQQCGTRFERIFGASDDMEEYSGTNARLYSKKLFFAQEYPKEREAHKDPQNSVDITGRNYRCSYIDKSRQLFSASEKIAGSGQVTFPDKCGGHLELVSRVTGRQQNRQPQEDHETYASYIPDHCRKNRRGRSSKKTPENPRKDQQEFDLNSSHIDVGTASTCGKKTNRPVICKKDDDFYRAPLASLYGRRSAHDDWSYKNNDELSCFPENSETNVTSNHNMDNTFTRDRILAAKSFRSADKPIKHRSCVSDDESHDFKENSKSNRNSHLAKHRSGKRRQRSCLKDAQCFIQSTYSEQQPYNECKNTKRWRESTKDKLEDGKRLTDNNRNERSSDFSQYKTQQMPALLNTEEILAHPPWTCTKWNTDVFSDYRKKPATSKWAYEVYSDTCLRALNGDMSTGSNSKERADMSEVGIVNKILQEQHQSEPDCFNHVLCVNNLAFQGNDFSRRMSRCSNVLAARQTARQTARLNPQLVANYNPLDLGQMMSEGGNKTQQGCPSQYEPEKCDANLNGHNEMNSNNRNGRTKNVNNMEAPFTIETIGRDRNKEAGNKPAAERRDVTVDTFSEMKRSEKVCITTSVDETDNNSEGRKVGPVMLNMFPFESQCSVDERLIRTVHAIKEDIEGVFDRLSSLDASTNQTGMNGFEFPDKKLGALNKATVEDEDTATKANIASDVVKKAATDLAVLITAFGNKGQLEVETQHNMSYDLYKAGKELYPEVTSKRDYDYDIAVYPIDCGKEKMKSMQQVLNADMKEPNMVWIGAGRLTPVTKCHENEDIHQYFKENGDTKEIKQTSRSSSCQVLTENNEQSTTESSKCITISESKLYPSTTDSPYSHKSSRKVLVAEYTESLSSVSSDDRGIDFIGLPHEATSDAEVSPQMHRTLKPTINEAVPSMRNRKKRQESITNQINNKIVEMFDYSSNWNEKSNKKAVKTKSRKKQKKVITDFKPSLDCKSSIGAGEKGEPSTSITQNTNTKASNGLPITYLDEQNKRKGKSKSSESSISSSVSSVSTIGDPTDKNKSLPSSPNRIKNTTNALKSKSGTNESDSMDKPACTLKIKSSDTMKQQESQYSTKKHAVKIVYKMKSQASTTESEQSFSNTTTVNKSKKETAAITKQKITEKWSSQESEGDPQKQNKDNEYVNKSRHCRRNVGTKKIITKNAESSDQHSFPLKEIQEPERRISPITNKPISTPTSRPLQTDQSHDKNNYKIKCVDMFDKNGHIIKEVQSLDKNDSKMIRSKSPGENKKGARDRASSGFNHSTPKCEQNSDTTSESTIKPAKTTSRKLKSDIPERRISRKGLQLRRHKDLNNKSQSSDTSSLSSPETNVTKASVALQNLVITKAAKLLQNTNPQSPPQALNMANASNEQFSIKNRLDPQPRKDIKRIILSKSREMLQATNKAMQWSQCQDPRLESNSTKIADARSGFPGKDVHSGIARSGFPGKDVPSGIARSAFPAKDVHSGIARSAFPGKDVHSSIARSPSPGKDIHSGMPRNYNPQELASRTNPAADTSQNKQHNNQEVHHQTTDELKDTPGAISASQLNISIMKLYDEINRLRAQLEASNEEIVSRHSPLQTSFKQDFSSRASTPRSFSSHTGRHSPGENSTGTDSSNGRYFGAATVDPEVRPRNLEVAHPVELTSASGGEFKRKCCLYRKYSATKIKRPPGGKHGVKIEADTSKSEIYAENMSNGRSGFERSGKYFGNKPKSPKTHSEVTNAREMDSSDYWAERQNLGAATDDFFDDTDAEHDGIESLDEDNEGPFGAVTGLGHVLDPETVAESKFQDYIFNNLPLYVSNGRTYTRCIFPTASALESKQPASQMSSIARSQYRVSEDSSPHFNVNEESGLQNGVQLQSSLKCQMEPSQPDLWPHSFEFSKEVVFKKESVYNEVTKGALEFQGQIDPVLSLDKESKENNIEAKSSSSRVSKRSDLDNINECIFTPCRKSNADDMYFESNSPLNENLEDISCADSPSNSSNDQFYTSSTENQEQRSPKEKPTSGNMSFQSSSMPMWSEPEESPIKSKDDYIPTSHVPHIVQRVKDMFFGSTKAEVIESDFDNNIIYDVPQTSMKYSQSSDRDGYNSRKTTFSASEQQHHHPSEQVNDHYATNDNSRCQNEYSNLAGSAKLENCAYKGCGMRDIVGSGTSVDDEPRDFPTKRSACDFNVPNERSPCYSEELWTENEESVLASQSLKTRASNKSSSSFYSPGMKQCESVDKTIRHYSDAISANGSKNSMNHEPSLVNILNMSSRNHLCSERSFFDKTSNNKKYNRVFEEGIRHPSNDRLLSPQLQCIEQVNRLVRPRAEDSDGDKMSGPDISSSFDKSPVPQNVIPASFMMHQDRACYVEHCGFRQKKGESTLTKDDGIDEINDSGGRDDIIPDKEEKNLASVETVVNDGNSSDDVKSATVNGVPPGYNSIFRHDKEVDEENEKLCKSSSLFDVINFFEDKHSANSISQCDEYSTDSGKSCDYGKGIASSHYNDASNARENMEINNEGEGNDNANENLDDIDEETTISDITDENSDNFSDDQNNEMNMSARNTALDEDEKESWYKTTDEESNI